MLSLSNISSSSAASNYFEKDDYYVREGDSPSTWYGKGAQALGFSGPVDRKDFLEALEGKLPDGQQLGRTGADGCIEHKPGWDLTFSAPKSVSIMAEVGADNRLVQAHDEAARKAIDFIESRAALTRVREAGTIRQKNTGNLATALFRHDTSRALDPQLHTHAVVINATQRQDGEWRSLESRQIYLLQKEAGMVYRAELAAKARELGYRVEKSHKDGRFELKEVPQAVRDHFSKRAGAVEKALADRGKTRDAATAKEKEMIAKATRDRKQEVDRGRLLDSWRTETRSMGFDPGKILEQVKDRAMEPFQSKVERVQMAEDAVRRTVSVLSEREASFRKDDLEKGALARGLGKVSRADIEKAVSRLESREELISRQLPDRRDNRMMVKGFTTPAAVKLENDLTALVNRGKGVAEQVATNKQAHTAIRMAEHDSVKQGHTWTVGQREATRGLLTTRDKVIAIQGAAGTAKTSTVLKTYAKEARNQGYQVRGLAPSASAAKQLEAGGGIKSQTIHSYLNDLKRQEMQIQSDVHGARYHQAKADIHAAKAERGVRDGSLFVSKDGRLIQKGLDGQYHRADVVTGIVHDSMQIAYKMLQTAQKLIHTQKVGGLQDKASQMQQGMQKNVWVVDESSMVGGKLMKDLLTAAEKHNARVVLVGDRQQLGSVEAGRAFSQMQDLGMKTYRLEEIVRQRDLDLKNAVENAYRGRAAEALDRVDSKGGVIEIRDPSKENGCTDRAVGLGARAEAIKKDFLSLSKPDREKTIVIAPGHDDRKMINHAIREGLKQEGTVAGRGTTAEILQNKGLTKEEMREAASYKVDDVVRFGRDYKQHGVEKGSYWLVTGSKASDNTVALEKDGKKISMNPAKWGSRSDVFRSDNRGIAAGDKIIWTRNDQDKGIRNGETAKVVGVHGDKAKVELHNGKTTTVNMEQHKHWDHAYARTSHSAQGATAERALIHAESWRVNLQHQRNMYVGISRAKQDVRIYTDDKNKLRDGLTVRTGEKSAAMEGADRVRDTQHERGRSSERATKNRGQEKGKSNSTKGRGDRSKQKNSFDKGPKMQPDKGLER